MSNMKVIKLSVNQLTIESCYIKYEVYDSKRQNIIEEKYKPSCQRWSFDDCENREC